MNKIFNSIKDSSINEIFWIIVGMIITKILEIIFRIINDKINRWKVTKQVDKSNDIFFQNSNIIGLAHAYPFYENKNIEIINTRKELFIDFPLEFKERILAKEKDFKFNEDKSFNGKTSFDDLVEITQINNLISLIDKHKQIVAEEFLIKLEENEEIFNGKKFGIYNLSTDKVGDEENAKLRIELFSTDYFTHKVFRSIYKELKENGHEIKDITKINELKRYKPFTTSLGVNTYVILDNKDLENKSIIFAKRSKYIGNGDVESKWHVSMNEGLTVTDIDDNEISLKKCLIRGLKEELGIADIEDKKRDLRFMDLFLEKSNFEIGITSFIELEMPYAELNRLYMSAKDSELETDRIIKLDLNKKEIKKFLNDENNKFTDAGRYVLAMLLNRLHHIN